MRQFTPALAEDGALLSERSRPTDDGFVKEWCLEHNVPIDYYNENPHALEWFRRKFGISNWSEKIFADVYLDDCAYNSLSLWGSPDVKSCEIDQLADSFEASAKERNEENFDDF